MLRYFACVIIIVVNVFVLIITIMSVHDEYCELLSVVRQRMHPASHVM